MDLDRGAAEVSVTVVSLGGERLLLPPLGVGTLLCELKELVAQRWGMHLSVQRLVLGDRVVEGDAKPLGQLLGVPAGGDVELSCVRAAYPRGALLRATARGDHVEMAQAINEGQGLEDSALSPLMVALAAGDDHAVGLLRDAAVPEPVMRPRVSTLGQAFRRGDLADVVRLLALRADPNEGLFRGEGLRQTNSGSPLHACCALCHDAGAVAVVELLCRLRADVTSRDSEGDSPLAHACFFRADEIYAALEGHGAKILGPYYTLVHVLGRRYLGWK